MMSDLAIIMNNDVKHFCALVAIFLLLSLLVVLGTALGTLMVPGYWSLQMG